MKEELGLTAIQVNEVISTKSFYLDRTDAWLLWIVYHADMNASDFTFADGVTDATFIDISELDSSDDMFEKAIVEINNAVKV